MKRIFNRLMMLAFAAVVSVAATGCPSDDDGNEPDLTTPKTDGSIQDLTPAKD